MGKLLSTAGKTANRLSDRRYRAERALPLDERRTNHTGERTEISQRELPVPLPRLRVLRKNKIKLQLIIALLFAAVILPTFLVILSYDYSENSRNLLSLSRIYIRRASDQSISVATELLEPVAAALRIIAEVAASNPGYFRTEQSSNLLYQTLISAEQIDAIYTSFEDGYHRVVSRIDADRRRNHAQIPAAANWQSGYIDKYSTSSTRTRHRSFSATWPTVIGRQDEETSLDVRDQPQYKAAKQSRALAITDPQINPDTGSPVMALGYPIIVDNKFIGFVGANITFDLLSKFLNYYKISSHSRTFIVDQFGQIIAHQDQVSGVRKIDGKIMFATLSNVADPAVVKAAEERSTKHSDRVVFTLAQDNLEYVALFSPFPSSFEKPWEVVIVAPIDDFIGGLKKKNRNLIILILSLIGVEALLIFVMAKRIAKPVEAVSREIQNIQSLNFNPSITPGSVIEEIDHLQRAVNLMRNSLRSFAAFVPIGIVRQLISTGKPMTLSGESRFLTIFFSDLEDFSSVSERLSPEAFMSQVSSYFEAVAGAITQESGTIDKFIGDSVMAFWGAPTPVKDQVYRACTGAVRAAYRANSLNEEWKRDGRPQMRIRIGLHCADVVVGNVGSSDRLSYTVMGDGVNVASGLEGLNRTFHTTICISDSVYQAVFDRIVARPIRPVTVKGRKTSFMAYELIGIKDAIDPEIRANGDAFALCAMTTAAADLVKSGCFVEAKRGYQLILEKFPGDHIAITMLDFLAERI
jgi:class 3 adenylate cyclase